jgi:regulator of protease activity HflC (stomatin/prohibitin superfamily)
MQTSTVILIIYGLILLILGWIFIPFLLAKYKAVKEGRSEVDLLGGWVKFVLWQPNEGVVILRNKKVIFQDIEGQGGTKFIFPIRGEEFAKVPLTIRMLTWEDDKILTRESLQIHMKVVVWWKVSDIKKYVFDIDRPAHLSKTGTSLFESSEAWLMPLTEGTIRVLASKASATQLITTATTGYLNVHHNVDGKTINQNESVQAISETIANQLRDELNRKLTSYGISIDRVEIQAIQLSVEVQKAIDKVWLAFLKPVQSEQEARARQIELEASARVLGADAVALIESLKSLKGSNMHLFQAPPFLQTMFGMIDTKAQNIGNSNLASLPKNNEKDLVKDESQSN